MSYLSYPNLQKPEPEEIVTRYMSFAQFIWIVTQQKLLLRRIDQFSDLFEGSAPQSLITQQALIIGSRDRFYRQPPFQMSAKERGEKTFEEKWQDLTARRKNLTYSTHASCWRWGSEPDGMWRLYAGDKEGVALQTTFARLEQSLAQALETEPLLVGKIQYGDYEAIPPFTEDLDHLMYKREAFAFEQEVRVLRVDENHYVKLCNGITNEKLSSILTIPWNLKAAIDSILVSPYADNWYLEAVQSAVSYIDENLTGRVRWSKLKKLPEF